MVIRNFLLKDSRRQSSAHSFVYIGRGKGTFSCFWTGKNWSGKYRKFLLHECRALDSIFLARISAKIQKRSKFYE